MAKKRWISLALAGLAGLSGLTAYLMRDNLFREITKPRDPFQIARPPPTPDYGAASAWALRPPAPETAPDGVDVFFLGPTTFFENGAWNAPFDDPVALGRLRRDVIPNHVAPFQASGPVHLPLIRQATLFASLSHREDSRDALAFAYADAEAAFDAFWRARAPGRGVILAGQGQGGLHLIRLLHARKTDPAFREALVAAYVLQQATPEAGAFPQPCPAPDATACLVSFNTVDAGDDRGQWLLRERSVVWNARGSVEGLANRPIVCVNPLTGSAAAPEAGPRANLGAAAASGLEPAMRPPLLPADTGARCVDGALIVEVNRPAPLMRPVFTLGARYLTPRYNLFWANLERDAQTRAAAWLAGREATPQPPPRDAPDRIP